MSAVHAGPFIVFAEEAHEDSADLLFMPEATASDWATVFSHAEVRQIGAGLALVQAGEDDRALYLLTEGTVGVRLPRDEGAFKTIDAPSVLGELAFFDGRPRSATLDAVTDVEVVRLDIGGLRPPARARARSSRTRCCATSRGSSRCACAWPPRSSPTCAAADLGQLSVWPGVVDAGQGPGGGEVHAQDAVSGRGGRGRAVVAVGGERRDPAGLHEDRDADQLHGAGVAASASAAPPRRRSELGRHPARRHGRVPARAGDGADGP